MSKNRKAATFILKHGLKNAPTESILRRLMAAYPEDGFKVHDIHNGLGLIERGFTPNIDEDEKTRRKRKNPLLHGDYADAACYVSLAIERFNREEKKKFVDILHDKL